MIKISFVLAVFVFAFSCISNPKTVWVWDNEHYLTQSQINKLDSLYKSHEKKTTNEIVLVTTPDYGVDTSILLFSVNFGRELGVGKKEKNNGVIIAFCGARHETMIATGYGTEKVLTDEIAKKIIDSLMIPHFKQGNVFDGLWEGSKAVVELLEKPGHRIK